MKNVYVINPYLVIIPTFNERNSLPSLLRSLLRHKEFDILIIDDSSPDGTADVVRDIMKQTNRVYLLERNEKLGLGSAYIEGFRWGLQRHYTHFIEMDGDGSHHHGALPWFIKEMGSEYDLMIGSRYIGGKISVVGWDFRRLLLSKFGNFYAMNLLGLSLTDLTSGFRCYSRRALNVIDLCRVHSNGYSFQIEMAYLVERAGFRVGEMPITFYERAAGSSKMSKQIVREAMFLPWILRLREVGEFFGRLTPWKKHVKAISH